MRHKKKQAKIAEKKELMYRQDLAKRDTGGTGNYITRYDDPVGFQKLANQRHR